MNPPAPHGRGTGLRPANRFESTRLTPDLEQLADDDDFVQEGTSKTEYFPDASQSIVSENDSPDIPFRYSLNPYRGCLHGCSYCYARPSHEYLGLDAGLDFETRILVKERAPKLFREFLARPAWHGEPIMLSGVTDCYQPGERQFRLTRQLLEIALEAHQPLALITKNSLVLRDVDLLREMATLGIVSVAVSITTLRDDLCGQMEPRTTRPAGRLRTLRQLSAAGVPAHAMLAPIIPGLNDSEIPALLAAVAESGARSAGFTLLRLPLAVKPIFFDWLARTRPNEAAKIEQAVRATRGGKANDARFGARMKGTGPIAEGIARTFRVFADRYGLSGDRTALDSSQFRPPVGPSGQMLLF